MASYAYKRILLKLSGEVLDEKPPLARFKRMADFLVEEIAAIQKDGIQVAIVIGGGNIFRGISKDQAGVQDRVTADHIGMLATIINALTLKDAFVASGMEALVFSAFETGKVTRRFSKDKVLRSLKKGKIVLLSGGTGNPFFSTDTAAALRALEIEADALFKGSKVDGIYDKDPARFPDARKLDVLTYKEAIERDIRVMDQTAFSLLKDYKLPIIVYRMSEPGELIRVISGKGNGSVVKN